MTDAREKLFDALPRERHIHPLTPEEHFEVVTAVAAMIDVLPEGEDHRGQARQRLVAARAKLERHWCAWCPVEVRDLHAVAHNAAANYGYAPRERKKMAELRRRVDEYRKLADAHFDAIKDERDV